MLRIDLLVDARAALGEGPLWDVAEQRLYWIDSFGDKVHRCDAGGGERRSWDVPANIGSMALRESGGAVCSLRNGFHFLDFENGTVEKIVDPDPDNSRVRMNDGKVDRQGRFVAGYMDDNESEPLAKLFRLDPDYSVHELDTDIICSNGPCWSRDGKTFYFADGFQKTIYAYDYDTLTGGVANKRVFAQFDTLGLSGFPDGATVDEEDHVWSVEVYGCQLVRLTPDGKLDRVVGLPVRSATSISFGGPDLDVAYVTSMARPIGGVMPKEREAGGVFAIYGLGVRGLPEPRFAG